ncbi:hypothetical protein NHX12_024206 [Muraenolepis orangiensis]|uniref:Tektin n=1 Tax=Muraenolepis orangiensis TaxID=630683 RepID=A0A9Q0EQB5_9TELE|nr:hypothetical protein NHX12_024206 [Muraenolepis orangiensis]
MSTIATKPALHHSVDDWRTNNHQLSAAAEHERHVSHGVRQEGRSLRNETTSKTFWDESDTRQRLDERIWDVSRCRDSLESCALEVDQEMEALTVSKEELEQALVATAVPLEVAQDCLTLRQGRRGLELVSDPAEEQLKQEVRLLESVQQVLQQHIGHAFEQLCVLQEARHQLTMDLQNKMDALEVDQTCLSLTLKSAHISLKPNPMRIPTGTVTPQEWAQFSQFNVASAQEAMHASQQMRETLQNEVQTQRRATEFALRKRTHHEQQAHHQLQWQLKTTEDEISEMEEDIRALHQDLQVKTFSLKLAHTRLENRTCRPGSDLCRDQVQLGLVKEVQQLEASIKALDQKLGEAQHCLQKMLLHRARMTQDLSRKQEALSLEQRSLNTRHRLTDSDTAAVPGDRPAVTGVVPLTNSCGRSILKMLA